MTNHKIVAFSASPSATSRTAGVADLALARLAGSGMETAHLRLRDIPADALLSGSPSDPGLIAAREALEGASGVIIATPIYKASYSGLLKVFLDVMPQFSLAGKAVLPIATGGTLAHVLALDYALRPVLQSMGARHVVQSLFLTESHLVVANDTLMIGQEMEPMLTEAIHHFKCSLDASAGDMLLGHPRPQRGESMVSHRA